MIVSFAIVFIQVVAHASDRSSKYYLRTVQRIYIKFKSRWSTARGRASSCSCVWITFALGGHRILFRSYTSSVYFGSGTSVSAALLRHHHYHEKKIEKRERDRERNAQVTRPCARILIPACLDLSDLLNILLISYIRQRQ